MLSEVRLANFKSFRRLMFKAGRLNVLTGLNGSGKSSFLQSLLFLRAMTLKSDHAPWFVGLTDEAHNFGTYSDVHYAYSQAQDDLVRIGFTTDWGRTFDFTVREGASNADEVVVDLAEGGCGAEDVRRMVEMLQSVQYISAYRLPPQEEHKYSPTRIKNRQWGTMGEHAVGYLAEHGMSEVVPENLCRTAEGDRFLQTQVDAWMNVVSPGAQVRAELLGKFNKATLAISFARGVNNHPFMPQNVGFGISYVLPLIVMLLSAKQGDCLIVENPEAHLHPRGQAELGRLLALVASNGVQIFVETHSDHVLNGIRVAVKREEILPLDVRVAFFSRSLSPEGSQEYEQESVVDWVNVVSSGEFDHFPPGFMDEWNKQLLALLQP